MLEALDAVEAITGSRQDSHVLGLCAGGIVLSTVVAHLAAKGEQDRIAGLTLGVTVLDQHNAGTTGAFMGANTAMAATAESARKGYLSGRSLAGVFAWLRPNDLIWNYWVSNYLMGKTPPAFDILFWNADATNLPAALHRDFLELALDNSLDRAGRGDRARHARSTCRRSRSTPTSWPGSPTTSRRGRTPTGRVNLLGSDPRFVLSTSGHIAALVNPPGNEKATFRVNDELPEEPEDVAREREHDAGHLVGRLDGVARRALRRQEDRAQDARRPGPQAARRRAGQLRQGVARAARSGSTARACTTSATAAASRCC